MEAVRKGSLMYRACIFDLDGTLCDTVESIAFCANRALREEGMPEASLEDYKIFVGDGVDMLVRRLLRFGGDDSCSRFEAVKSRYMEYFKEDCIYHVVPYPGIPEMLLELKGKGVRLGVISNKPHGNTLAVIGKVFGNSIFDFVQGQSDAFPRKPDPKGALYVAKKLGVCPKECLYIGDTGTDMKTGNAAGMHTVGVLWGFRDEEELTKTGACQVIGEPSKIVEIF